MSMPLFGANHKQKPEFVSRLQAIVIVTSFKISGDMIPGFAQGYSQGAATRRGNQARLLTGKHPRGMVV
jgi:hypothetical protein